MRDKERTGANASSIKLTVRMPNAVYQRLHAHSVNTMASHNRIMCRAVEIYLEAGKPKPR